MNFEPLHTFRTSNQVGSDDSSLGHRPLQPIYLFDDELRVQYANVDALPNTTLHAGSNTK